MTAFKHIQHMYDSNPPLWQSRASLAVILHHFITSEGLRNKNQCRKQVSILLADFAGTSGRQNMQPIGTFTTNEYQMTTTFRHYPYLQRLINAAPNNSTTQPDVCSHS